ncbi:OmpA family protein [Bradyrhizobium roseum]|uniref:OmpA family protein n=1 Tax=Bradyrhizobium roseum TaxID=3056648 RepID=UPI0026254159|nr:OmpA family protein [Bradyrhizobium roseus]WKA26517.1 OmpA family protein [Bradyrhizobium roseus]
MTHLARTSKLRTAKLLACAICCLLAGATAAFPQSAPSPAAGTQAAPPPPPTPVPFDDALLRAANDLFSKANLPAGNEKIELVVDPLIDGISGAQSTATRLMQDRIVALVSKSYPRFEVRPFSTEALTRAPVVLIGTFTAINNAGAADGPRDAYRICLALADLRSKSIVSKGVARAKPEGIDVTPTPAYADTPVWAADPATSQYIKTCQGTKLGDPIDPVYVERIGTSSLISDAILEYDDKRYREALAFYRTALKMTGGDQLRVRSGIYLANSRLNRRDDATDAFGNLVDYSLGAKKLSVRFLFKPGSTQFVDDPQISAPYPMWLSQIATRAGRRNSCINIVGHTSKTGPPLVNERLSVLRAQYIKDLLQSSSPALADKLKATGVGSREVLIGTGRDDASDAIDRRVDFNISEC